MQRFLMAATLLAVMMVPALAADPFTGAPASGDQPKAAELASMLQAGNVDQAVEGARAFLASARDESARTEAMRVLAEGLRKKGDWKAAAGAYLALKSRYEKTSDDYVKYDAIAEIMRVSPAGTYQPALPGGAATAPTKALSDDEGLTDALRRYAEIRVERLRTKVVAVKRARTPEEVAALMAAIADEVRQLRILSPNLPPDVEREADQAAGLRLAELGKAATPVLNAKQSEFQQAIRTRRLTEVQRRDIEKCHNTCLDMAKAEEGFQGASGKMAGTAAWTEGAQLVADSRQRQAAYEKLAAGFVAPPPGDQGDWNLDTIGGRRGGWGGGGGGGGGGWGGGGRR